MEKKQKSKRTVTIRAQVVGLISLVVLITVSITNWISIIPFRDNIVRISEDYMQTVCKNKRELLQKMLSMEREDSLSVDNLKTLAEELKFSNWDSAYMYIVDRDGKILYHPSAEKIGLSVENSVILELVNQIANGQIPKDGMATYNYRGTEKYAVYCLTDNQIILVLTVDESEVMQPVSQMEKTIIITGVLVLIAFVIFGFFASGMISKPITYVSHILLRASKLDFMEDEKLVKICKFTNQSGEIARAAYQLRSELKDTIQTIQTECDTLSQAFEGMIDSVYLTKNSLSQVNLSVEEIAQGAQHQAEDTTNANEEIVEIGTQIEAVKKEVDYVTIKSNEMLAASDNAMDIISQLTKINQDVIQKVIMVQKQTNETNQSVQRIQEVTNIITEIASRTSLLALNASIEAARAGEAGKGFAVVAVEIKQLAEQSNDSAKVIQGIVDSLITDSEKVVEAMESVNQIMTQQSVKVADTDATFQAVKAFIDMANQHIAEIDARTGDINQRRVRIIETVTGLSAIAQENAASTEETAAAVVEVSTAAERINENTQNLVKKIENVKQKIDRFQF